MSSNQNNETYLTDDDHHKLRPWLWLVAVLATCSLIVLFQSWDPWADLESTQAKLEEVSESTSSIQISNTHHFEFYTLLPSIETTGITHSQHHSPQSYKSSKVAIQKDSSFRQIPSESYVLQAGSFHSYEQANKRKSILASMGIEATVQTITTGDNIWHRVRIGPKNDPGQLNNIQERLHNKKIECQLYKIKS
ncbi:SPOR domain-containing protein [Candidatus Nitrosacidococcus tergens]|uniref:Sporulation domain protein n=1 Tax=Candidatus Nitrosacidococcus tergens TaxID=553981 RepID=A0A7G1Q747_9GAMM|nr:SPOR domain-containing protein [Candidatus Nitrosacidococcus tergens]CAB1274113.1 Sporulation domain protein [Candidatus Nitrosacidococcus tergens]